MLTLTLAKERKAMFVERRQVLELIRPDMPKGVAVTAYVIARVNVTDPDQYAKYKLLTPDAIEAAGGRFIVRGGDHEVLEGPADDRRVVVLEFDSMDAARAFYDSPGYAHARDVRQGAAEMEMTLVEGT